MRSQTGQVTKWQPSLHFSKGHRVFFSFFFFLQVALKDETRTHGTVGAPGEVLGLTTTFQSKLQTRPRGVVVTGSPYNTPGCVQMSS